MDPGTVRRAGCTFTLFGNTYEVGERSLAGLRVQMHFNPYDLKKEHLPAERATRVAARVQRAWGQADAKRAERMLERAADDLEREGYGAAAGSVREGLKETLTSMRLGLPPELRRVLETTNASEDRLLAPLPVTWVGVQKVLFAAGRGIVAGIVIFPLGILIVGSAAVHLTAGNIGPVAFFTVMAALVGATIGLTLGTLVGPQQINIMFALILTPMLFTGCTQYPWAELGHERWFQILTLFHPMTYASEGMRAAMVPALPHMNSGIAVAALIVAIAVFGGVGLRGFRRRSVD